MVFKVIAGYGREDHVAESHAKHGFCHPFPFLRVYGFGRTAFIDLAERTTTGADGATKQKGCGTGCITLPPIRAAALLANRVEPILFDQGLYLFNCRGIADGPS